MNFLIQVHSRQECTFFQNRPKTLLIEKKITVFIETAFIAFMYIHDYIFFRFVCASAWSLTLIYAGRKVFSIHFGGLTLQKTWF